MKCERQDSRKTRKNTRGFTLIETIAAGFIFAIASLSLSTSLATSNQCSEAVRQELGARSTMRAMLTEMRSVPFAELETAYKNRGFDVPGLRAPKGSQCGFIAIEDGPDGTKDLLRIRLRIRWMNGSTMSEIEAVHLVTRTYG